MVDNKFHRDMKLKNTLQYLTGREVIFSIDAVLKILSLHRVQKDLKDLRLKNKLGFCMKFEGALKFLKSNQGLPFAPQVKI